MPLGLVQLLSVVIPDVYIPYAEVLQPQSEYTRLGVHVPPVLHLITMSAHLQHILYLIPLLVCDATLATKTAILVLPYRL